MSIRDTFCKLYTPFQQKPFSSVKLPYNFPDLSKDFRERENHKPLTNKKLLSLVKTIDTDAIIVDAGCHVGDTMIKLYGFGHKIFAIDPNTRKVEFVKDMINLNNLNDVIVIERGISDTPSLASEVKKGHAGMWKLKKSDNGNIQIDTLDSIIGVQKVGLLHLDVEGYEYKALKGALNIIINHRPHIMVEILHGDDKHKIYPFLEQFGYVVKWTGESNVLFVYDN
jgi:FkbM family methyltransferase